MYARWPSCPCRTGSDSSGKPASMHARHTRAPRLAKEREPVLFFEMAVEVAGEDTAEGAVGERQRERIAPDELRGRHAAPRDVEHRFALVEADDVAREVLREKAGAARDVERP